MSDIERAPQNRDISLSDCPVISVTVYKDRAEVVRKLSFVAVSSLHKFRIYFLAFKKMTYTEPLLFRTIWESMKYRLVH